MASKASGGCGALVVALLLVVAAVAAIGNAIHGGGDDSSSGSSSSSSHSRSAPDPNDPDVIGDQYGAEAVCETFVKRQLKSPSSADFSDEHASHLRGPVWSVAGAVDSDNSFGASLRNNYTCKVKFLGKDNWHLAALTGLVN